VKLDCLTKDRAEKCTGTARDGDDDEGPGSRCVGHRPSLPWWECSRG